MYNVAVVNASTLVSAADAQAMTQACSIQLSTDVCKGWASAPAQVTYFAHANLIPAGMDTITLFDNADQAGALGYHTEGRDGSVFGKIFAKETLSGGGTVLTGALSVSSVLSHEVIEMFADRAVNKWADGPDGQTSFSWELCDPVEGDSYPVSVAGQSVMVSNFVLPEWFDDSPPKGSTFDFMKKLSAPFTMTAGGYVVTRSYDPSAVQQVTAHLSSSGFKVSSHTSGALTIHFGEHMPQWKRDLKMGEMSRHSVRKANMTKRVASCWTRV